MRLRRLLLLSLTLLVALSGVLCINPERASAAGNNCSWTGSAGDSMFSTGANWSNCGGTYPQAGDNIIFGTPVGGRTVSLLGVSQATYGSITFNDNDYYIEHSRMNVTGGVTDNSSGGENRILSDLGVYGSSAINGGNSSLIIDNAIVGSTSTVSFSHVTVYQLAGGGGVPSVLNIGPGVTIDDAGAGGLTGLNINSDFTTGGDFAAAQITVATGAVFTAGSGDTVTAPVTVSNGATLVLDGTVSGGVTVASGGVVKGGGTDSGTMTVQQGGTIAPGHSPGCMTTTNLAINGTYRAEIGGTTACTGYDQLIATGSVDVSNATLSAELVNGFTPTAGQTFTIVNNQGSNPVTGTFSGLAQGATVTSGGYKYTISYTGGDGNDIVLTAVGPADAAGTGTPGSPNTGFGMLAAHPLFVFIATTLAALAMTLTARRLRTAEVPAK
jgi:fibronectin-binding autotransporter adhesin